MDSPFELHPDRLATTDEKGGRVYLYPADVKGFFRRQRNIVHFIFLCIFLFLPWIKYDGRQAVMLNISERHFDLFGLSLRAHNAPLIFLVLAAAGFGLFFITSIWGRVWCGWACPQTVFIDFVYRKIERLIEGPALKRRQLHQLPWNFNRTFKFVLKWFLYIIASLIITHSFLAYFVGTEKLSLMIRTAPSENWGSFLFILFSTGIILFDFAWFREQFCIIACPYGRFQSVLMDSHSMIIGYDQSLGEPRATPQAKVLAKNHGTPLGNCVNCYRCVQVCPVGIDIRRGTQMECIACTACADACDEVMLKVNKPTGLIRYTTERKLQKKPTTFLRLRPLIYFSIFLASITGLYLALSNISALDIQILRNKDVPYTINQTPHSGEQVFNHFNISLRNQDRTTHHVRFELPELYKIDGVEMITAFQQVVIKEDETYRAQVFIKFPSSSLKNGVRKIRFKISDQNQSTKVTEIIEKEMTLVGPNI